MAMGSWEINVITGGMPEKIATAIGKLGEMMVGAEYTPIAYLGAQVVNGTNHAVLAEQVLTTGRDTHNIVVLIFNEKPGAMEADLVSIERVIEGGAPMGGIQINVQTDIPEDAKAAWNEAFYNFVGSDVKPFALLGTQVVKGTNYIFAATVKPLVPGADAKAMVVTINTMTGLLSFADMLANKQEAMLGYSFTWLKGGLGKPLGEWP